LRTALLMVDDFYLHTRHGLDWFLSAIHTLLVLLEFLQLLMVEFLVLQFLLELLHATLTFRFLFTEHFLLSSNLSDGLQEWVILLTLLLPNALQLQE